MPDKVEVGQVWTDSFGPFRIMAVAEGWALTRRKNAIACGMYCKDILRLCVPHEPLRAAKGKQT